MKVFEPANCESVRGECRRLVEILNERLADSRLTLAFGESATAGRVAYEFSLFPGAGLVLQGGVVCYAEEIKTSLLGVSTKLLDEFTAESPQCSRAIAEGVKRLIPADITVGITGLVRSGGSETPEKPVGSVFIAVSFKDRWYEHSICVKGSSETIVETTVREVCRMLLNLVEPERKPFSDSLTNPKA